MSEQADGQAGRQPGPLSRVETMMGTLRQMRQLTDREYRAHRDARHLNDKDMAALEYLSQEWKDQRAVSPKDVAAHLGITSATTTSILDRLEADGYLHRRRATADRRGVFLTPASAMEDWVRQHPAQSLQDSFIDAASRLDGDEVRIVQDYFATVLDTVRKRLV